MEINVQLGSRHSVSLIPSLTIVTFDKQANASFYDYTTKRLEGRYNYVLSEAALMYGYYTYEDTDQTREALLFGDVTVFTRTAGLGFRRTINDIVVTSLRLGYSRMDFHGGAEENYSGPVYEGGVDLDLSDVTVLSATIRREPFQSFFVNSNYYLNLDLGLRLTQQIGPNTYWQVGGSIGRNDYATPIDVRVTPTTPPEEDSNMNGLIDGFEALLPSQGVKRSDRSRSFEIATGFRLRQALRLLISYNHEWRDSNIQQISVTGGLIDPNKYQVDTISMRFEFGLL